MEEAERLHLAPKLEAAQLKSEAIINTHTKNTKKRINSPQSWVPLDVTLSAAGSTGQRTQHNKKKQNLVRKLLV